MPTQRPLRFFAKLMVRHWESAALLLTSDVIFVLLLYNLQGLLSRFNLGFYSLISQTGPLVRSAPLFLLIIAELFALILVYSFFNYWILRIIPSLFGHRVTARQSFGPFLALNLLLFLPLAAIIALFVILSSAYFNMLLPAIPRNLGSLLLALATVSTLGLAILIFSYTLLNLMHFAFMSQKNLKQAARMAFAKTVRPGSYAYLWTNLKIVFIYGAVLLTVHMLVKKLVLTSVASYLHYFGYYKSFLLASSVLVGYLLLSFNRIHFYLLFENDTTQT